MSKSGATILFVLRAVALAMAVVGIILSYLAPASVSTIIVPLLGVGLLALAIAGKESVSKALGTGWTRGVRWRDVVVEPGPPARATLLGPALARARALGSQGSGVLHLECRGNLVLGEFRLLS